MFTRTCLCASWVKLFNSIVTEFFADFQFYGKGQENGQQHFNQLLEACVKLSLHALGVFCMGFSITLLPLKKILNIHFFLFSIIATVSFYCC